MKTYSWLRLQNRSPAPRSLRTILIAAVQGLLLTATPGAAQYTAIQSGSWTSPYTWFPPDSEYFGQIPGPADFAYIPGSISMTASSLSFGLTADSSGSVSVSGAGSSLSAQSLTVAGAGLGYLQVSGGGSVTATTVVAGRDAPNGGYINGYLTVQDTGSLFSAQSVTVGAAGNANFLVYGGGAATVSSTLVIGRDAGGSGYTDVFGTGSSLTAQSITVGGAGYGRLFAYDGGSVSWSTLHLAVSAGSRGTASFASGTQPLSLNLDTIDFTGAGNATLNLGLVGYGAVTATASSPVVLGGVAGSSGRISVSVGSTLAAQSLTVGAAGNGYLEVSGGGSVTATTVMVGRDPDTYTSGLIRVQDAGSSFSVQSLTVGAAGNGYLEVSGGGSVTANTVVVGRDAPPPDTYTSGLIRVQDAGSSFSVQSLTVGAAGYGYLEVSGDGSVSWSTLHLAVSAGSRGTASFASGTQPLSLNLDTIDFTGAGNATLNLGLVGYGAVTATASSPVVLGGVAGSSGRISVSVGSTLAAQSLTVGAAGNGYLEVSGGGSVTANTVVVGRDAPPPDTYTSDLIRVQDAGSSFSVQSLTVGAAGNGYLEVSGGGSVTANTVVVGRDAPPPDTYTSGLIRVQDAGSSFSVQSLTVGAAGYGYLEVSGGGSVTATTVMVGRDPESNGQIRVQDAGSSFSAQSMTVGAAGNGYLDVSGGGSASWSTLYLAVSPGSYGDARFAGGTQPLALNLDAIDFTGGGNAFLSLGDPDFGAPVTGTSSAFPGLVLGGKSGSSGTINVMAESTLSVANDLTLGVLGTGNLFVGDYEGGSGQVTVGGAVVMAAGSGSRSTVTVTNAGSKLTINGTVTTALTVGEPGFGGIASLNVLNGGQMHLTYGGLVVNSPSQLDGPSTVTVSGAGSSLILDGPFGNLRVADGSGWGRLMVTDGGYVRSSAGYIGGAVGTVGEAIVTGPGSTWVVLGTGVDGILEVGRYLTSSGTLTVSNGGMVQVSGQTTAGLSGGIGTIVLDGGTLSTGPVLFGLGGLLIGPSGKLVAGPAGPLPSVLQLGKGTSAVAGALDLRGANGTPGALRVDFVQPDGQSAGLNVTGQIQLAFATTNPGSVGTPPANGASSTTLSPATGNSLLSLTGTGTLDLTGATLYLVGGSGLGTNWDPTHYYSWQVVQTGTGVTVTGLNSATVDVSQFGQSIGSGAFFLTSDPNGVYVAFSPVPEPVAILGIAVIALALGAGIRRWLVHDLRPA